MSYQDTRWREGVLSLCRDAVGVFYSLPLTDWSVFALDKNARYNDYDCASIKCLTSNNFSYEEDFSIKLPIKS